MQITYQYARLIIEEQRLWRPYGWVYSFIGQTESGQHRRAHGPIDSVRCLKYVLETFGRHDHLLECDLPSFGGPPPEDTEGVWSWDYVSLLVGPSLADLEILPRCDLEVPR